MEQPKIKVGIMSAPQIRVSLDMPFATPDGSIRATGEQTFVITSDGRVSWQGRTFDTLLLKPLSPEATFEIFDVTIGVNFHWERRENQRFSGSIRLIVEGDKLTIINVIPVENYLLSVISSEMSAHASLELLKAHAVISRSWLLSQIEKKGNPATDSRTSQPDGDSDERLKWYDREDHANFDVCADDHCQRYQGVTRQTTSKVAEAIKATFGQVLTYRGEICDARFSKCCGGVFEEFENCWEPRHFHYLEARHDSAHEDSYPDLRREDEARQWIMGRPDAYCNTSDASILRQVLNNYDQETTDFYRWHISYGREELSQLVRERSGIDFGQIIDLQPIERGTSGRLIKLRIIGTLRTLVIGKELEIRRTLSPSHLYSSAFIVERHDIDPVTGLPGSFTLHGAGWGHGVGLCQIGAAVMGEQGHSYRSILSHYFKDSEITKLY